MSNFSIKETEVGATRRFIDKKTNSRYYGNEVVWVEVKEDRKIIHCGYYLKATRMTDNPSDWTRVEPRFKKIKYKVKKFIVIQTDKHNETT